MSHSKYKSEYQRLRRNIIRRTKSLLSKGYYIPEEELLRITPKKYSELSKPPTKRNIQRLQNIQNIDIPKKFKYLEVDYETGEVKEQSYKYGISQHISESKYGVISDEKYNKLLRQANETAKKKKVRSPKRYTPFTDDYYSGLSKQRYDFSDDSQNDSLNTDEINGVEYVDADKNIVERIERRLEELTSFISFSRFSKRRSQQEEYVRETANRIYTSFIEAKDKDYNGLAAKLSEDPMKINRLIEKISSMYKGDEDTEEQITEFLDYIQPNVSLDDAKSYDHGYDSYDEFIEEEY